MLIIGCDYHPGFQQIAFIDPVTGECGGRKLTNMVEAESFYRALRGGSVRVGMEATGHARWFERLLAELNFELWIGDPAEIRAQRVRKQKTDRQDAEHLMRLLVEGRFPRIWYRVRRIAICGNCFGIAWCRCGRESRTSCRPLP